MMRALVACGWFGIQCWIGGEALYTLVRAFDHGWATRLGPGFSGHTGAEWLSFFLFWALNVLIVYRGMDLLRKVENWAAPFVLVMTAALLVWVNLAPVVAAAAKNSGREVRLVDNEDDDRFGVFESTYVLVTSRQGFFTNSLLAKQAEPIELPRGMRRWTDDYSNLWQALKFDD